MKGFSGGRDRARIPGSDPRTQRAIRRGAGGNNNDATLAYDQNRRLGLADAVKARIDALERRTPATPVAVPDDLVGGTADGVFEAIPDVGAGYVQAEVQAVILALKNNLAEQQAFNARLLEALREHGIVRY